MKPSIAQSFAYCLILVACGPPHIRSFDPQERDYKPGEYAAAQKSAQPAQGSLYSEAHAGFLEDTRALRAGDIVMIRIDEEADAQGGASVNLSKDVSRSDSLSSMMGLIPALKKAYPDLDPEELVALTAQHDFEGEGNTQRAGKLTGRLGVRVKKEMPNGDLFVEGTKVVMINHEEYHLYTSGLIRPSDIDGDNSVDSSLIADARVEFTGRGDVADQVERGWLTKFLDFINPL